MGLGLDDLISTFTGYRTESRFPVLAWKPKGKGAVLMRSSQPRVGYQGHECKQDIDFLRSVANLWNDRLVVVDARPGIAGFMNRARGGGYENVDVYSEGGCLFSLEHMAIENIHEVIITQT